MQTWKRHVIAGFLVGFAMGMFDFVFLFFIGTKITIDDEPATFAVVTFFAFSFGLFGAAIAGLRLQRKTLQEHSKTIEHQFEALQESQRALVEQEKLAAVGRLAGGIAHEVRNPLGVIRSSAQLAAGDVQKDSDTAQALTFIVEEVDRLDKVVTKLLAFTKPLTLQPDRVSLAEMFEEVATMLRTDVVPTIDIKTQLTEDDVLIHVDHALFVQLLFGLGRNAAQSLEDQGTILIEGMLHQDTTHEHILIRVRDDGRGIEQDMLHKVFEPFFTTRADGTGLGLAMAKKIAQVHGAELKAISNQGLGPEQQGACFQISILPA